MAIVRNGNKPILLVIDFQVGVVKNAWEAPRIGANIARAVERARAQGAPVLWVQHEHDEMPQGSPQWQFVPELLPAASETRIYKRYSSAFEETPLEQELARFGATHVVVAGAMSTWCVRAACYAALDRGYDLTLVKDAHTTDSMTRADGSVIDARGIVDDLNIAMTWLDYPGRKTQALTVDELAFG